MAEAKAAKATALADELCVKLAEAIRANTDNSASAKTPAPFGTAHSHRKSKGTAGYLNVSTAAQHHVYQSPQRKAMTANKRVSVRLPKSFPSETLSILSSSDSKNSNDGVLTIRDDTSDKEDKGNNSVQEGGLAQVCSTRAKPRGGCCYGTPLRLGSTLPSCHTKANGSSSKEDSSSASMAIDSNNKSTATASCKEKEDGNQHKANRLDRSSGSQAAQKHMTLVRGGAKPTSPPALHHGQCNLSSCKGALPDHHNQLKADMLDGIWPGSHNVQLLNWFVEMNFLGDWTA